MMLTTTRKSKVTLFRLTSLTLLVVAAMTLLVACGGGSSSIDSIIDEIEITPRPSTAYEDGVEVPGIPTSGAWEPDFTFEVSVDSVGDPVTTTVNFYSTSGHMVYEGYVYTCRNTDENTVGCLIVNGKVTQGTIDVSAPAPDPGPDLIIFSISGPSTVPTDASFSLDATVLNQGTGASAPTTLRYYLSSNSTISTSDTELVTHSVDSLPAGSTTSPRLTLTAAAQAGTYYYGVCVDSVLSESYINNNCSTAVMVTVVEPSSPPPVTVVEPSSPPPASSCAAVSCSSGRIKCGFASAGGRISGFDFVPSDCTCLSGGAPICHQ